VAVYRISAEDRRMFKRCRRQWDFAAPARGNRQPRRPQDPAAAAGDAPDPSAAAGDTLGSALRKALDVYYYPGMWEWPRHVVVPLVHRAVEESLGPGGDQVLAHRLMDDYSQWAPGHDRLTPVQVAMAMEVNVADPVIVDRDLTTPAGDEVRYRAWVDALTLDGDNRPWLMFHRLGAGPFEEPAVLALDEEALTACWAYEAFYLDRRVAGAVFTEVHLGADAGASVTGGSMAGGSVAAGSSWFRRTEVPYSRREIDGAGRQLGVEALLMVDVGLVVYPSPSPEHCRPCAYRSPCLAVRSGADAGPILAADYEERPEPALVEGRLGGGTWSMNRGARPPRFE
jgi:hypothetical protein